MQDCLRAWRLLCDRQACMRACVCVCVCCTACAPVDGLTLHDSTSVHYEQSHPVRCSLECNTSALTFFAQYIRRKPCILPWYTISFCAAFQSSSCVSAFSNWSLYCACHCTVIDSCSCYAAVVQGVCMAATRSITYPLKMSHSPAKYT